MHGQLLLAFWTGGCIGFVAGVVVAGVVIAIEVRRWKG